MEVCVYLQNTLWPFIISGCKYQFSTIVVGIAFSLCCLDCQRWEAVLAVCSEQPSVWAELFPWGGVDTCTLKGVAFPTAYPLKLSKVILNLALIQLLRRNWSSLIVVLCPWLNCYRSLSCSLDLLRYAHPPKSISQVCARLLFFFFFFLSR